MKSNARDKLNASGEIIPLKSSITFKDFFPHLYLSLAMCSVKMKADIQAPTFQW